METNRTSAVWPTVCILILAAHSTALSKIIYVDDDATGPCDGSSWARAYRYLQDALGDAASAEKPAEIRVAQGVYRPDRDAFRPEGTRDRKAMFRLLDGLTLRGGFAGLGVLDPNTRDIELYGATLSGDLAGNDAELSDPLAARGDPTRMDNSYHVIGYDDEAPGEVVTEIEGFTIASGHAFRHGSTFSTPWIGTPLDHRGGGLFLVQSRAVSMAMTVRTCTFERNYAEETGGAVCCLGVEALKIVGCQFRRNGTHLDGGALHLSDTATEMVNCQIQRNQADAKGGGIWFIGPQTTLMGCTLMENTSTVGGGMYIGSTGGTVVKCFDCTWRENLARAGGGGINISGGELLASKCRFIGNWSSTLAGVILANGRVSVQVAHCLFCGNVANDGGGVLSGAGDIHFVNCTAYGNRAPRGGFFFDDDPEWVIHALVEISNCIVHNTGNEVWSNYGALTIRYTDMPSGRAAVHDPRSLVVWGPGNIEVDSCFAHPGHWELNDTPDDPDDDSFVEGDYHLKSQAGRWDPISENWIKDDVASPCIDAGDPMSPTGQEPFPNGGRINMGAYGGTAEASKSYFGEPVCETIIAGDINGDCRVDFRDLQIMARHWLREQGE